MRYCVAIVTKKTKSISYGVEETYSVSNKIYEAVSHAEALGLAVMENDMEGGNKYIFTFAAILIPDVTSD